MTPILLTGLLLTCGLDLPDAGNESFPAIVAAISIDQTLPRDFVLPLPLFASNSAWNQTATTVEVLPESDQQSLVTYRVLCGDTTSLHPPGPPSTSWPFMDVNYEQIVIEKLNQELEQVPIACGPWTEGQDPAMATIENSNFDVVEAATHTITSIYLPLILRDFTASTRPSSAEPMPPDDVTYRAYQIQDISEVGGVDALVGSRYDMLVLEPTCTDWSSDDKHFDTRGMVARSMGAR